MYFTKQATFVEGAKQFPHPDLAKLVRRLNEQDFEVRLESVRISKKMKPGRKPGPNKIIGDSGQHQAEFISQDEPTSRQINIFCPDFLSSQDPMSLPSLECAKPSESLV